jgi:outer membrane protein insertion porin family
LENGGKSIATDSYCDGQILNVGTNTAPDFQCRPLNGSSGTMQNYDSAFNGEFLTYNLNLSWAYNTLNRPIFPTNGMYHRLSLDVAVPGSDVEYQKAVYDTQAYLPLWDSGFVLRGYGKLGYGNDLPFYKNFFAGGYGSVRGFDINTLGPKYESVVSEETNQRDWSPEEVGGNALIQGGMELVLPMPTKSDWARQIRPVMFIEGGQVFDTESDKYDVDFNELRYSAGVGFTWITMIGPLSLSYAYPLNDKKGDDTKSIQFEIGRTF